MISSCWDESCFKPFFAFYFPLCHTDIGSKLNGRSWKRTLPEDVLNFTFLTMRVPLFQWNMDFHHWNHLYMGNIWGWNFNFFVEMDHEATVMKNSPSIFYPMPRVRFFFRFNTADNNNSLDVIATYWERWARRYVFPSVWCWCEFSLDGRSAILMAQCSRISPSKSTTGVNVLFV